MNTNRWRIIFNRTRRMQVVVSDIARTAVADTGSRAGSGVPLSGFTLRMVSLCVLLACGLMQGVACASEIHRDTSALANQQPTILTTASGLPQVNIRIPDSRDVSMNKFARFDVDKRGVINNNARAPVQTQLAGWVTGNPWRSQSYCKPGESGTCQ